MAHESSTEPRADSQQPAASISTAGPSPAKSGSANGTAPVLPSIAAHKDQSRHSRRPSRAERYEGVIANARETLRRATGGYEEAELEAGPASDPLLAERRRRSKRLSSASFEPLPERDWRETVRSLLNVVEGMSQQLALHDELTTELKIAQSNLSLASAHSEFLEETLRRREARTSASHLMSRQHSTGEQLPGLPSQSRRGSADASSQDAGAATGLFGLGLTSEPDAGGAKSFFRLPSKRRSPNPGVPGPAESTGSTFTRRLRSVGSSPALNKSFFSSEPVPPLPPRASTSTIASNEFSVSPNSSVDTGPSATPLAAEVFSLRTQVSSLETECTALRSSNASLKRNNETLVGKCAELEKTKDDLLSELENLSVELFSEANALVAEERRARAKAEEEVERLTIKVTAITAELDSLPTGARLDTTGIPSPQQPAASQPTTPHMSVEEASQPFSSSPATSPVAADPVSERPQSVASIASSAARNWFSFGRGASQPVTSTEALPPLPTSSSFATSVESLGDGSLAGIRDSPRSPLISSPRPDPASPVLAVNGSNVPSPSHQGHDLPPVPAATSKGKEKARTLDLGISISDAEGSRGMSSAFSTSPGSADTAASARSTNSGGTARATQTDGRPASARSPSLPHMTSDATSGLSPGSDEATSIGHRLTEGGDALAVPTRRPRRPDGQAAPRPYAMHYERTPPGLHADMFRSNVGGPSAAEMTAGSKSPKSPNELRWAKVSGNLQSGGNSPAIPSAHAGAVDQQYSTHRSYGSGGPRRRAATTDLPHSPAPMTGGGVRPAAPSTAEVSRLRRPSAPSPRAQTHSSPSQHRPTLQPVDTTSSMLAPPTADGGERKRPHSAGTGASHPGFPRTNAGAASSYSTAQAALASGPASANPAGGSSSTFTDPNRSPVPSESLHGSFATTQPRGMTPSTSHSSLASNSSLSSTVAPSSSGHSTLGTGGIRHGLGSPEDTKAAQDLENLMQNILEMSEGLFGQEGVDADEAHDAAVANGGERAESVQLAVSEAGSTAPAP
ncbi:hypothetical protein JCM3774_001918 [Rhodotorula dairenensis]